MITEFDFDMGQFEAGFFFFAILLRAVLCSFFIFFL